MDITASVAKQCGVSIFSVLEERAENVVDVISYMLESKHNENKKKEEEKVISRKNDGFWDM